MPNRSIFGDQYTRALAETVFPDSASVKSIKGLVVGKVLWREHLTIASSRPSEARAGIHNHRSPLLSKAFATMLQ